MLVEAQEGTLQHTWIPFNRPYATGEELRYIQQAIENGHLSCNGTFTRRCHQWLVENTGAAKAFLTQSCTAALEMCALLAEIRAGDEIIMPSFTFVSTANAFTLAGGVPVFVDIRPDTLNIDEDLIEAAITPRTKAICVVHYAGVGCEMNPIREIARRYHLMLIEDAAQGTMACYEGHALGSIGNLGALSFHETKNVISGEGGALLVNDEGLCVRAEMIWEKGTNRSAFFRGEVDKYTWVDLGSSFAPSEITAAFLWAQLENARLIIGRRLELWQYYYDALAPAEARGFLKRPTIPPRRTPNAHMFYVLTPSLEARTRLLKHLLRAGFQAVFHYVPLHTSPAGRRYGRVSGSLAITESVSDCLVRLPLWVRMPEEAIAQIVDITESCLRSL